MIYGNSMAVEKSKFIVYPVNCMGKSKFHTLTENLNLAKSETY